MEQAELGVKWRKGGGGGGVQQNLLSRAAH